MTKPAAWRWTAALGVAAASVALAIVPPLAAGRAAPPSARTPVVVELFTSEGCSSCPPADAVLRDLQRAQPVQGAEIIPLGEHVDYWDQLGWRDRFSAPAFTRRQQRYGDAMRVESIYTPQMVVDGRAELVGSSAGDARRAIDRAAQMPHGRIDLAIDLTGGDTIAAALTITGLPQPRKGDRDETVVAVAEDGLASEVRRGENRGRTLVHAAVVRSLDVVGAVDEGASGAHIAVPRIPLARDWDRTRLTIVAFVQESRSRRIVAAAAEPLQAAR